MNKRVYEQLSESERQAIALGLQQGQSMRAIARALGRSASTISREIERNSGGSGYMIQGNNMLFVPGAVTKRACPEAGLMELEQRMGLYLSGSTSYEVRNNAGGPPLLVLHFSDGSRWELTGTPTAQTKYGGPGERVFLEVAPERMACSHGAAANAQCLKVREVRFADNGVRQSAGAWQPLHGEIEGYTHQPGVRNVLRLNRFERPQPVPADASAQVYVLDMVVETEQVR